jgi:predicted flap endonuclease-1-like 5' DNA nuclease
MTFFTPESDDRPAAADPFRFALTAEPFGVFPKMFQDMLAWQMAASGQAMKLHDEMMRFWFSGLSSSLGASEGLSVAVAAPPVGAAVLQLRAAAKPPAKSTIVEVTPTPAPAPAIVQAPAAVPAAEPAIDAAGDFDDASVAATAPAFLAAPEGKPDDLQVIKGIGPKLERLLHDLGVWHYRQIAAWAPGEIVWINGKIDFKGRVQREKWVAQARALAAAKAA